jgi:hypothetical protein
MTAITKKRGPSKDQITFFDAPEGHTELDPEWTADTIKKDCAFSSDKIDRLNALWGSVKDRYCPPKLYEKMLDARKAVDRANALQSQKQDILGSLDDDFAVNALHYQKVANSLKTHLAKCWSLVSAYSDRLDSLEIKAA